ncbi:Uma2 family endonuclease [Zavarzinella formosa]|uniref:Uma2 family endonuclease n=1 Tax=Zavarzinella formosa TaxID=360055 RepID=UPI0003018A67|nr:Uma2 family endonuclease [Zavarzinella formosa]
MATATLQERIPTMADVMAKMGDIPPSRILMRPSPGTATEDDVLRLGKSADKRICELIDGVLVEKPMGMQQALLVIWLGQLLGEWARRFNLGLVFGDRATLRMIAGNIRIPDVCFIPWDQLPNGRVPTEPIADFSAALTVEILSPSNTAREMREKREEYFASGTQIAWELDPENRTIRVYTNVNESTLLTIDDQLTGDPLLPGFNVSVREVFGELDRRR